MDDHIYPKVGQSRTSVEAGLVQVVDSGKSSKKRRAAPVHNANEASSESEDRVSDGPNGDDDRENDESLSKEEK